MANSIEYGVLAYGSYNPEPINNLLDNALIGGAVRWITNEDLSYAGSKFPQLRNSVFGFGSSVYKKPVSGEVVVAFRGTEPSILKLIPDAISDVSLAFSIGIPQVIEAVKLYVDVIKKYPDSYDQITFTGHSLGGGVAGIMSLMFVQDAHLYAPAPFGFSMFNPVTFATIKTTFESARIGASPEASAKLDLAERALDSFKREYFAGDYSRDRRNEVKQVCVENGAYSVLDRGAWQIAAR